MGNSENAERKAVLHRLWEEFGRLNREFFEGSLVLHEIRLSTRKQYGGYFRFTRRPESAGGNHHLIVLSWLAYQQHGWEETLETFRHEVAHIVHRNHSRDFWDLAYRLGCTRRYARQPEVRKAGYYRFIYACPVCQERIYRRKALLRASCSRCDRRFNPDFLLQLVSDSAPAAGK